MIPGERRRISGCLYDFENHRILVADSGRQFNELVVGR